MRVDAERADLLFEVSGLPPGIETGLEMLRRGIVNEGEYCMMNTLDLSVDQAFWELERNPWVVRNLLDNFVQRYMYVDELQAGGGGNLAS